MLRTRLIRMTAVIAFALLTAACGGDGSSTPSSGDTTGGETSGGSEPVGSSSAEEYATGACTAINDWITSITTRASGLAVEQTDPAAGQGFMLEFLDGVITDTDAMITEVEALGVPDVEDGEAASTALLGALSQVRDLYQGLRDSVADLDTSDPTAFATALSELTTGLDSGSGDVGSALDEFQNGDLAAAFQATPACAELAAA
jgi:hypothetical protein